MPPATHGRFRVLVAGVDRTDLVESVSVDLKFSLDNSATVAIRGDNADQNWESLMWALEAVNGKLDAKVFTRGIYDAGPNLRMAGKVYEITADDTSKGFSIVIRNPEKEDGVANVDTKQEAYQGKTVYDIAVEIILAAGWKLGKVDDYFKKIKFEIMYPLGRTRKDQLYRLAAMVGAQVGALPPMPTVTARPGNRAGGQIDIGTAPIVDASGQALDGTTFRIIERPSRQPGSTAPARRGPTGEGRAAAIGEPWIEEAVDGSLHWWVINPLGDRAYSKRVTSRRDEQEFRARHRPAGADPTGNGRSSPDAPTPGTPVRRAGSDTGIWLQPDARDARARNGATPAPAEAPRARTQAELDFLANIPADARREVAAQLDGAGATWQEISYRDANGRQVTEFTPVISLRGADGKDMVVSTRIAATTLANYMGGGGEANSAPEQFLEVSFIRDDSLTNMLGDSGLVLTRQEFQKGTSVPAALEYPLLRIRKFSSFRYGLPKKPPNTTTGPESTSTTGAVGQSFVYDTIDLTKFGTVEQFAAAYPELVVAFKVPERSKTEYVDEADPLKPGSTRRVGKKLGNREITLYAMNVDGAYRADANGEVFPANPSGQLGDALTVEQLRDLPHHEVLRLYQKRIAGLSVKEANLAIERVAEQANVVIPDLLDPAADPRAREQRLIERRQALDTFRKRIMVSNPFVSDGAVDANGNRVGGPAGIFAPSPGSSLYLRDNIPPVFAAGEAARNLTADPTGKIKVKALRVGRSRQARAVSIVSDLTSGGGVSGEAVGGETLWNCDFTVETDAATGLHPGLGVGLDSSCGPLAGPYFLEGVSEEINSSGAVTTLQLKTQRKFEYVDGVPLNTTLAELDDYELVNSDGRINPDQAFVPGSRSTERASPAATFPAPPPPTSGGGPLPPAPDGARPPAEADTVRREGTVTLAVPLVALAIGEGMSGPASRWADEPGMCARWVRQIIEATIGNSVWNNLLFNSTPVWEATANGALARFRNNGLVRTLGSVGGPNSLQPGDILFQPKGSPTVIAGRQVDAGHMAIYIGGGKVAENTWRRVQTGDAVGSGSLTGARRIAPLTNWPTSYEVVRIQDLERWLRGRFLWK